MDIRKWTYISSIKNYRDMNYLIHHESCTTECVHELLAMAGVPFEDTGNNAVKVASEYKERAERILRNRIVLHVTTRA